MTQTRIQAAALALAIFATVGTLSSLNGLASHAHEASTVAKTTATAPAHAGVTEAGRQARS